MILVLSCTVMHKFAGACGKFHLTFNFHYRYDNSMETYTLILRSAHQAAAPYTSMEVSCMHPSKLYAIGTEVHIWSSPGDLKHRQYLGAIRKFKYQRFWEVYFLSAVSYTNFQLLKAI